MSPEPGTPGRGDPCLLGHRVPEATEKFMANEDFIRALDTTTELELTVTGRRSGREISIPVWFVREGDELYLVPVRGSDSDWYKNAENSPTIRLRAGGAQLSAGETPITHP